jgi:tRNA-2-methylthio-N6-dimethylallyladenosine synthase
LTTDVILGFPTETEEDFQATLDLVKSVEFDAAYIFKYSTRSNTKAADAPDDVPQEEKERRHALILELQRGISLRKKQPDAGCCQRTNRKPA